MAGYFTLFHLQPPLVSTPIRLSNDVSPGVTNKLKYGASADAYATKWETINSTFRSSVAAVKNELALEPLRQAVTKMGPEMTAHFKTRQTNLVDFNSYKRRITTMEKKMESAKDNTGHQEEMEKLKSKLEHSEQDYTASNTLSKEGVVAARAQHDEIIDMLLITNIVCQGQLFKQMAEQMQEVVATLPKDKVDKVLSRIKEYMEKGGPPSVEKSSPREKGPPPPQPIQPPQPPQPAAPAPIAVPISPIAVAVRTPGAFLRAHPSSSFGPHIVPSFTSKQAAPPPPPPPPGAKAVGTVGGKAVGANVFGLKPVGARGKLMVVALFDHVADDADELNFKEGDSVEVVEKSEGDLWWRGRCNGKEGLFPVNYVKIP
jgi:hypothetical protein